MGLGTCADRDDAAMAGIVYLRGSPTQSIKCLSKFLATLKTVSQSLLNRSCHCRFGCSPYPISELLVMMGRLDNLEKPIRPNPNPTPLYGGPCNLQVFTHSFSLCPLPLFCEPFFCKLQATKNLSGCRASRLNIKLRTVATSQLRILLTITEKT
jgi:hypothetical protein